MEALEHDPHPDAADMRYFYGVKRRPTMNGDMFHIDNLMCLHASNHAFGETERREHSQVHHRQLLQSLHDIHKNDRLVSQRAMGTVLEGTENTFRIKTTRERQQRWLVNQRQALFVLSGLAIMTANGEPALLAWAHYMYEHSDGWVKRASKEVVLMFLMPEIIVALHFEAEVGESFEFTSH
jgi:hypothetical protein